MVGRPDTVRNDRYRLDDWTIGEAGDVVAGSGVVDGGLFEKVQVGGVVDVTEGIELVMADANVGEVEVGCVADVGG